MFRIIIDTSAKEVTSEVLDDVYRIGLTAMLAIDRRLVERTPVLTGRARSNWLPSVRRPRRKTIKTRGTNAPPLGPTVWPSRRTAGLPNLWLSNNLDYIQALNAGYSPKAPPGYIQTAVQEGVAVVANLRL